MNRFKEVGYANGVQGATLEEVKQYIDALVRPQVVVQGYRGYDIIRVSQTFYGIEQSEVRFDLKRLHMGEYPNYVKALSIDEGKKGIDRVVPDVPIEASRQPAAGLTNLALNKVAVQSTTVGEGGAQRAVDGITNGVWASESVTHTTKESQPWWQVDLGSEYFLDSVRVWNRTDCCGERLSNFAVLVSETPLTSTDLVNATNQPGVTVHRIAGSVKPMTDITVNRKGRFVRIQLVGNDYLSLAEVQIWGK